MYTFWLITTYWKGLCCIPLVYPRIEVTFRGKPVGASDVPDEAVDELLDNLPGLFNNGRWTTSV